MSYAKSESDSGMQFLLILFIPGLRLTIHKKVISQIENSQYELAASSASQKAIVRFLDLTRLNALCLTSNSRGGCGVRVKPPATRVPIKMLERALT